MYEEIIKNLRYLAKVYSICGNEDTQEYKLAVEAADAIEELQKPRWISVEERLPELAFVNEWYLVALESGCVESLGYTKGKGWFSTGSPVTHWMPLPEPPKEE